MTEQRLIGRAEGRRTNEELVRSVPEPAFTPSWHPHSHAKVIDATELAVDALGMKVENREYSLSASGARMFGVWQVGRRNGKMNCLGFRNSIDMTMSIGYISILTVIVCTNQITHGNFFLLRRHTAGLTVTELANTAQEAIGRVVQDFAITDGWHESLKKVKLGKIKSEQMLVQAMRTGIVVPSKFREFDKLYFGTKDKEPVYDHTLYGFHGTMTQLIRGNNYGTNIWMNQQITTFVEEIRKKA